MDEARQKWGRQEGGWSRLEESLAQSAVYEVATTTRQEPSGRVDEGLIGVLEDRVAAARQGSACACGEQQIRAITHDLMGTGASFHPAYLRLHRLRESWLQHLISVEAFAEAAPVALTTLPAYRALYGAQSPLFGLQLFLTAKILSACGETSKADALMRRAFEVLRVCCGADHELCDKARDLLGQLQAG
mmetsp:Transcript_20848/g.59460  ORF Transcript_20848/g.59460 Transcript_20848/m.59460 type:complete len:189 (-) Transcript_20848:240-806(-)